MEISIDKVYAALQSLNASSAMGPDKVHPRVLKACASEVAAPLCMIFNKSFVTGSLPKVWLESVVVLFFKSKSRYDPSNYHPVSLTSMCCKTMGGTGFRVGYVSGVQRLGIRQTVWVLEAQINRGSDVFGLLRDHCHGR